VNPIPNEDNPILPLTPKKVPYLPFLGLNQAAANAFFLFDNTDANTQLGRHTYVAKTAIFTMGRGLHTVAVHLDCWTITLARYTVQGIRNLSTTGHARQMQTHNLAATNVILEQQYSPWVEACILLQSTLVVGQLHWHGTLCTRVQVLVN
jgi:hypothetical protein